jgi:hypothetical protein
VRKEARAAAKAAKAARPRKNRWYKQVWQVYQSTREGEPLIWLWLLLLTLGIVGIGVAVGLFVWKGHAIYLGILALPISTLADMYLLINRFERVAYARIEGKEGASSAAIGQIRRGWTFEAEPVAIDPRSRAMVYRGVGRAGIVLVAEGGVPVRRTKLIESEKLKVSRVAPDVPIIVMVTGRDKGEVELRKLSRTIQRLRPKLSKAELAVVQNRLKALGGLRAPIPKGIDPLRARPDYRSLRGR